MCVHTAIYMTVCMHAYTYTAHIYIPHLCLKHAQVALFRLAKDRLGPSLAL